MSSDKNNVVDINDRDNVFDLRPGNRLNLMKFCSFLMLIGICLLGIAGLVALCG